MAYRHCCVIDSEGAYIEFVLVKLETDGEGQEIAVPQYYTMREGERLVEAAPPAMRPYAGAGGFIHPKWDMDTSAWVEAAPEEEISAWEADHPAPAACPEEQADQVRAKRDALLAATDWTQVLDAPIDEPAREAMRAYRQALRDIPQQEGFPDPVTWPDLPVTAKAAP